jgi:ubiquinone/menaquinone biosynthesis C-methylase UbiE
MISHNPFAEPETAAGYEAWYQTTGKRADHQEKALLKWLLGFFPSAASILEVGCGTGHFTRWLSDQGGWTVGLDLSWPMLAAAKHLSSPTCLQGEALRLPFSSGSFDLVTLITTLEFLPNPAGGLAEAKRVARQGLLLGVLNRRSRLGQQYKKRAGPVWEAAHLFSMLELRQMLGKAAGERTKVYWRTTLWPLWPGSLPLPWGSFIGMVAKLL